MSWRKFASADGQAAAVSQYGYDALSRPTCTATRMNPANWEADLASLDACTADAAGPYGADRIVQTTYDEASRPTAVADGVGTPDRRTYRSIGYAPDGEIISDTDANGATTHYCYDGLNRLTAIAYPDAGFTTCGGAMSDYEGFGYDGFIVNTRRLRDGSTLMAYHDALRNRVGDWNGASLGYDHLGRVTHSLFNGAVTTYAYDAAGRLTREAGPLGALDYGYQTGGPGTSLTWTFNGSSQTIDYDRDAYGEVTSIHEHGSTSALARYGYNDLGQRTSVQRGNSSSATYGYDGLGRLTSLQELVPNGGGTTLSLTYNPANEIISRTNSNSAYDYPYVRPATTYTNNSLNEVTSAGGAPIRYDDQRGNITSDAARSYSYTPTNQLQGVTASDGSNATLTYDAIGRLVKVTTSTAAAPSPSVTYIGKNAMDPVDWANDGADWANTTLQSLGTQPGGFQAVRVTTSNATFGGIYPAGPTSQTEALAVGDHLTLKLRTAPGQNPGGIRLNFRTGGPMSAANGGASTYDLSPASPSWSVQRTGLTLVSTATTNGVNETVFDYVVQPGDPGDLQIGVSTQTDTAGKQVDVYGLQIVRGDSDAPWQPVTSTTVTTGAGGTPTTYIGKNSEDPVHWANDGADWAGTTATPLPPSGGFQGVEIATSNATFGGLYPSGPTSFTQAVTAGEHLTLKLRTAPGSNPGGVRLNFRTGGPMSAANAGASTYDLSPASPSWSVQRTGLTLVSTATTNGVNETVFDYVVQPGDPGALQIGVSTQTDTAGKTVDVFGLQVVIGDADAPWQPVTTSTVTTNSGAGTSGTTTQFAYAGDQLVAELDGAGNVVSRYVPGPDGEDDHAVWYRGSGTSDPRWLMRDQINSVIGLTNASGSLVGGAPAIYDEYGVQMPGANQNIRLQYTGQMYLPEAGLYNYKARAYNPGLGRFMQTDPIGYASDMNLYAYVNNSPVTFDDPSGEDGPTAVPPLVVCGNCSPIFPNTIGLFGISTGAVENDAPTPVSEVTVIAKRPSSQTNKGTKTCVGTARGLSGNTRLYGRMGAFGIVRPNTAAIIPSQFGRSRKAQLRPYVGRISGTLTGVVGGRTVTSTFNGVTDVIDGTSPIPGVPVRDALQVLFPNQFIVEVTGGADVGPNASVTLNNYPANLACPTGTH